ncbi:MAG: IS21-like element helper ATPase IstB [Thermodesulfobacteriota bacterium]|nr:IS21-like element helper ATPase IstB [Thermodesulfobacteriota bacterium]
MNTLRSRLKDFKLSGIYNSFEERLEYAQEKSLAYREFLELLMEDEYNNRRDNSYKKRYSKAKLPSHKTMEDFDFMFQPSINKKTINDCLTCNFIKERKNIIFIGNPGTGKTHLSVAIGIKALLKGYKVLFTPVSELLHNLNAAKADNSYYQKVNYYLAPDLLILDELGFKKLPGYSADDFFEIISKRYEKSSLIITTNKSFENWDEIFSDHTLASAILDRIVHYSTIFKINGHSYRSKDIKRGGDR